MSWVAGYRALHKKRFVPGMLKALDRHRERQIRRIKKKLDQMPNPPPSEPSNVPVPDHFGFPFSYSAQLANTLPKKKPKHSGEARTPATKKQRRKRSVAPRP
jgi:hypothetical protein